MSEDEGIDVFMEVQQRKKARIWEEGFKAGQQAATPPGREAPAKNPYGAPVRPGPPPFPEFTWSVAEQIDAPYERWAQQMREFAAAWNEWSRGLR